jgi:hypothetical protein
MVGHRHSSASLSDDAKVNRIAEARAKLDEGAFEHFIGPTTLGAISCIVRLAKPLHN